MVWTPDGLVPIEDIEAGMWVLAPDETGELRAYQVTQTFERTAASLIHVALVDLSTGTTQTLTTTPEHPFYFAGVGFIEVGALSIGAIVVGADGPLQVVSMTTEVGDTQVFNFQVEDAHSYLVGELGAWVHNADYTPGGRKLTNHAGNDSLNRHKMSPEKVDDVIDNSTLKMEQRNGATVHIKQEGKGVWSFVIEGQEGIVTAMPNVSKQTLDGFAERYGWEPQ
jgi:hypothetical protein